MPSKRNVHPVASDSTAGYDVVLGLSFPSPPLLIPPGEPAMYVPRAACLLAALLCWQGLTVPVSAGDVVNLAPNPDFNAGRDRPSGWKIARGRGVWGNRTVLQIDGSGRDAEFWQSVPLRFQPGRDYRFEARVRRLGGTGSIIAGPEFVNRDYVVPNGDWQLISHVFRVPDGVDSATLRLGVWESSGAVQFDAVRVTPVRPVYQAIGGLRLGAGESVLNGRYTFWGTYGQAGSNDHRPLVETTTGFNTDRWTMDGQSRIVYRFALPGHPFNDAAVTVGLSYHVRGACVVEVSLDGRTWRTVTTLNHVGTATAKVAPQLFPCHDLFIRVRANASDSSFQVNEVSFEAGLQGVVPEALGRTTYAEISRSDPGLTLLGLSLSDTPSGSKTLELAVANVSDSKITLHTAVENRSPGNPTRKSPMITDSPVSLTGPSKGIVRVTLPGVAPGQNELVLRLQAQDRTLIALSLPYVIADFERDDYGQRIALVNGPAAVWWCDATHKIPRERNVPTEESVAATFSAARNDHEAVQVVVRPSATLKNLTAKLTDLSGPGGARILSARIQVLREHYHFVQHPTDATGWRAWWPDALPPLRRPIEVPAGTNQPFWVLVDVPADALPGDYAGMLTLKADGWGADIPLRLHVWSFALPACNHLQTAFGFSPHEVFRYHNIRTEADRRAILDLYFQNFAAHRISPYDPTPLDPIRVRFRGDADPPAVEIDWTAYDAAMTHALATYHFNNFQLHLQGMGGGSFASRVEPAIGRYREGSPQYEALFSRYLRQLSDHLRAKGWLKKAYVYWFDEPEPRDYAFVRAGMSRIKKYGPEIPRMLTEEPGAELAGSVDIWCPLTPNYNFAQAESFRARGDRFWWYVCTGPKAPYCTLFIDHPATELRVWLWQTWQNQVEGNLVWATNWWTSPTAFPDTFQNPYDDPMSYTDGYGLARGTRAYWGNGDGRFLYPPESAATPGRNGGKPIMEPPVSSLRWEMLREGVEDYEFLYLLRDLLARRRDGLDEAVVKRVEALLDVPQTITRDMTTFTTAPAPIYARRAEIARAIEELSRGQ